MYHMDRDGGRGTHKSYNHHHHQHQHGDDCTVSHSLSGISSLLFLCFALMCTSSAQREREAVQCTQWMCLCTHVYGIAYWLSWSWQNKNATMTGYSLHLHCTQLCITSGLRFVVSVCSACPFACLPVDSVSFCVRFYMWHCGPTDW